MSAEDASRASVGGHRPPLQFELSAPYVSLFTMSCGPWQDIECQAQIKANEGILPTSNEKAGGAYGRTRNAFGRRSRCSVAGGGPQ